ncbi:MAG: aminoacyl-tRNA hydrolase [Candidatus Paracaedibacteraceae bacterium]|nr:aminoacyl-tRNA hydrolase [Candidatus Paracaedibacteraceae bacterium]
MYLIVGLGNPGTEYRFHRHNAGFLMVDILHQAYGSSDFQKNKWQGLMAEGNIKDTKVLFIKPQTYMNLSGPAVSGPANFYKIPLDRIIVIHDDLDLPPANTRIKKGGGHGGHNGLKSIDAHLGKDYWRLRIGIGHPGIKDLVSGYVLNNIPQKELHLYDETFFQIRENFSLLLQNGTVTSEPFLKSINNNTS